MVGLARQIQVLIQCLFLAVTVALLVVWNMELAGVRVGKRSPLGPESSQSKRHVPRFLNSDSFPMSDTSLGLPLRVTGRPRPCLDLLPRPSFLVSHHVSRRFSPVFSQPVDRACALVIRLFPVVSTVAARAVLLVCQVSSCLRFNGRYLLSLWLLFFVVIWSSAPPQRFLDVFHTRALVKSSLYPKTLRGQRLVMARGGIAVQIAVRGCSHGGGSDNHQQKGSAGLLHSALKRPGGIDPSLYFLDDGLLTGTSSALQVFFITLFAGIADIGHSVALTTLRLFQIASLTGLSLARCPNCTQRWASVA